MANDSGFDTGWVFLAAGQRRIVDPSGVSRLSPVLENIVVVAKSIQDAQVTLEHSNPEFMPLNFTSLKAYEDAVIKIRSALAGDVTWPLVVADGMDDFMS